jgi:hypothetical protein
METSPTRCKVEFFFAGTLVVCCQCVYFVRVLNELRPDTIKKINDRPVALMQRENVGMYLEACAKVWKLPPAHLFIISDLFDMRDLRPVSIFVWQ